MNFIQNNGKVFSVGPCREFLSDRSSTEESTFLIGKETIYGVSLLEEVSSCVKVWWQINGDISKIQRKGNFCRWKPLIED
jgi:hypothetical protein